MKLHLLKCWLSRDMLILPPWGDPARQSVASLAHALSPVLEEHESRQGDGWDLSTANTTMAKVRWPMKASWREKELMPGLLYIIGSRSDSMPESVTPGDHWSLFWAVLLFSKLTREEQKRNFFGKHIYFNCWNTVGAMIFHPVQPGVIWSQLEESFERALSMDPDAFEEADLEVLKERPWQQMWNMYLQDLNFWRETFGGGTGLMLRVGDLFVKNRRMEKDDGVGEARNSKCVT